MFDPSKLDLDLESKEKKSLEKTESEKIADSKADTLKSSEEEKVISPENTDDLADLLEADTDTSPEENPGEIQTETNSEEQKDKKSDLVSNMEGEKEKIYGSSDDNSYDKEAIIEQEEISKETKKEENNIVYNVNIKSVQDILKTLTEKNYDFVTIEPFDSYISIVYRKDKIVQQTEYIKYPVYTQILLKAKYLTHLKVEETEISQEGKGEVSLNGKGYKVSSKTAPSGYGEKLFLKAESDIKVKKTTQKKPVSFTQILGFLGAALFAALIIGGGFLTFVLLNSNSVSDLAFFNNLGVDVGSIRDVTAKLVNGLFGFIIFIETLFLFTFTFKAVLTKKEFKSQKIGRTVIAIFFLVLTFISGFVWITLSNKINDLKGQNYGQLVTYDNSKFLSNIFDENGSVINTSETLIGPVTLRFDIKEIINQLVSEQNSNPQSIKWIIGDTEVNKPVNDLELIHTFTTSDLHEVLLEINILNALGEPEIIELKVAEINIENIIEVNEKRLNGGGKIYQLDAQSLENLGKIEWYYIPDLNNLTENEKTKLVNKSLEQPANTGYQFDSKIVYDEELILGIKIITGNEIKENLDKIFVFSAENGSADIQANIQEEVNLNDDFEYTFRVTDLETILGNGTVESLLWKIEDKTFKKEIDLTDIERSSEIVYNFPSYGDFTIYLDIIDSRNNVQTIEKTITISKKLKLSQELIIQNDGKVIDNMEYNKNLNEYIIDEVGSPTTISLDARTLRSEDQNYVLRKVEWDFGSDEDIDSTEERVEYELSYEGRHQITGIYYFEHRRKPEDIIILRENIYIEGVKKEAQLYFEIKQESQYVPVVVGFDASKSQVKDEDIVKFEWDYGDGNTEIADAVVSGYKYSQAGDYTVTLSVTTESGKVYTYERKLILKPKPKSVEITSSLKTAPIYQEIDFSSDKSQGQISTYFWDFGDGSISTRANPSHKYEKPGSYEVKLRVDFADNRVMEKTTTITIIDL